MWGSNGSLALLIALLALCACCMGAGRTESDEKFIGCAVCNETMRNIHEIAVVMRDSAPYKKLGEDGIEYLLSKACDADSYEGRWLRMQDIVEVKEGTSLRLELTQPGGEMKCKQECKAIQKSCFSLLEEELDAETLVVYLFKNIGGSIEALQELACKKWTKRCGGKPIYLPADYKRTDYPFKALTAKEVEIEKMMESMKASGLGGQMYDRDAMAAMTEGGEDDEDYDPYAEMMGMGGGGLMDDEEEDEEYGHHHSGVSGGGASDFEL